MGTLVTGTAATYVEELHINTEKRYEIICITREVERIVAQSGIVDGLVLVNPMHITASCYVNDLEYGLHHDIMAWLEKLAPFYGSDGRSGEEYHTIVRVRTTGMLILSDNCWASRSRCRCETAACIWGRGNRSTTQNLTVSETNAFW